MKRVHPILRFIGQIFLVGAIALGLIFIFSKFLGNPQLPTSSLQPTSGYPYPPPDETSPTPYPAITSSPELPIPQPTITPSFTLFPTLTLKPGPTPTLIPVVMPAKDSSGTIFFFSYSGKDAESALYSQNVDESGKMVGSSMQYSGSGNLDFSFIFSSPDRKHLAITGEWGAFYPIYLDKSLIQPLSPALGPVWIFFNWFPDNRHILYRSSSGLLILADPVNGERSTLAYLRGEQVSGAAASPDGRYVVYSYYEGGHSTVTQGLWIVDSTGQNARLLSKEVGYGFSFAWSPDGKRIAFYDGGWATIDADGSNLRQLTSDSMTPRLLLPQCYKLPPVWSPDSRTLAVVSASDESWESFCPGARDLFNGNDIYLIDVETGTFHQLLTDGATGNIDPAWSPDGSQIVFVSNRSGSPEIWLVNIGGSDLRQMTRGGNQVRFPVWSGK